MRYYVDTSVLGLVALSQEGGAGAAAFLQQHLAEEASSLVSSTLLKVECARLGQRTGVGLDPFSALLEPVATFAIDEHVIDKACGFVGELKSLDAIHLATALELAEAGEPVTMLTHDARLAQTTAAHGLEVIDPTA